MTLEVEAPGSYEPERRYILDVMLGDRLRLDWRLHLRDRPDVRIALAADPTRCVLVPDVLFATPPTEWLTPAALPSRPLAWCEVAEQGRPAPLASRQRLPVLYGAHAPTALIVHRPGGVELTVDVFGGAFFMLSRYEELVVPARDLHGRFAAASSIAHAEGFLGLPIVDAYVEVLWSALHQLWPRLERRPRQFRIALSHDVDRPLASVGRSAPARVRQLGADALVRRDAGLAARRVRSWAGLRRGDQRLDPYNTFDFLMDVSERHATAGAFYFLATEEMTALDGLYTLEQPWIESLVRRIHERGHEIGLHASYHSHLDPRRTEAEFLRLLRAAKRQGVTQERWGGRHHYLRWENPVTWSNWQAAGLDYDSTLGYADRIGFRAGTCHEFAPFHLLDRRPLRLRERPLHVMDGTLFEYMRLSPDAALENVIGLARECRRYGGTLSLLWHNSSLPTARQKRWYENLVGTLLVQPMLDS
jgi:peptidoglycan/xylan/chitin deacetylase (PgdA/CDA1 family)